MDINSKLTFLNSDGEEVTVDLDKIDSLTNDQKDVLKFLRDSAWDCSKLDEQQKKLVDGVGVPAYSGSGVKMNGLCLDGYELGCFRRVEQ